MPARAKIIDMLQAELHDTGRGAQLLVAMLDRAMRIPDYASELQDWIDTGTWLMLRRAAAPFGDFHGSAAFAGALYELDAMMTQIRKTDVLSKP